MWMCVRGYVCICAWDRGGRRKLSLISSRSMPANVTLYTLNIEPACHFEINPNTRAPQILTPSTKYSTLLFSIIIPVVFLKQEQRPHSYFKRCFFLLSIPSRWIYKPPTWAWRSFFCRLWFLQPMKYANSKRRQTKEDYIVFSTLFSPASVVSL